MRVLVAGGSRGLGLELARECGRRGAKVALCARDAGELRRAREDLAAHGIEAVDITCDLTDEAQVKAAVAAVTERFGGIDVLFNNAGRITVGPLEEMTVRDYRDAIELHLFAPLYASLAVLPAMRARRFGRIVNIASIGGLVAVPHLLPYSASKFALVGLSEGMRSELAGEGIRVTTACPGLMRTGSPDHAEFKGQHRKEYAWFVLSDSSPFFSIGVTAAARRIVDAAERGEALVVLSPQAKIVAALHAIAPVMTGNLLGVVARLLPGPGGIGQAKAAGAASHSALAPPLLTGGTRRAEERQNQLGDTERREPKETP